jgi:hypothetical protein
MRAIRFVLPFLALTVGSSVSLAQIVQSKSGYLIYVKYKKGQVIKQSMAMSAVENTKLKSSSEFITKCLNVDKNGVSTVEVTVSGNGKTPSTKKTIKVDKHGKPLGATIDGYSGTFVWPDKPTKLGQSWVGNIQMAGTGQGANGAIKSTYKLAGFKTIRGVKVASIAAVLSVGGNFEISGNGMIYVRVSDGQMHSADFNLAFNQFSESNKPTKLKLLMTIRTAI